MALALRDLQGAVTDDGTIDGGLRKLAPRIELMAL